MWFNKISSKHIISSVKRKTAINTCIRNIYCAKLEEKSKWDSVIKEAERAVDYPTSFLSVHWILNDEKANVATHVRKLIGKNHPLLETAKNLLLRDEHPTWGLIVLLMSQVAGINSKFPELECARTADILHGQRTIAKVTEMIKTSHLLHNSLIETDLDAENASDLNFGNKLVLLCGDYLLSTGCHEIARLKNSHIQEIISSTLRDLAESQFLTLRDKQDQSIPSKPLLDQKEITIPCELGVEPLDVQNILGNMKAEWTLRNILAGASLLARSCQSTLILANHESHVQELVYNFGRSLALAWQASLEKDVFKDEKISLVSAPVMFHLEHDPDFYEELEKGLSDGNIDYELVRETVINGPGIERTHELQNEFSEIALDILENNFPGSESRTALINIVKSM